MRPGINLISELEWHLIHLPCLEKFSIGNDSIMNTKYLYCGDQVKKKKNLVHDYSKLFMYDDGGSGGCHGV